MKNIMKNSSLVMALAFLFALPFMGFGFIGYQPGSEVLGTQVIEPKVVLVNDDDYAVDNKVDVVDQVDLNLVLTEESFQKFYDVIPETLVDTAYSYLVVLPKDAQENVAAQVELNQMKVDLVVNKKADSEVKNLSVTILVVK